MLKRLIAISLLASAVCLAQAAKKANPADGFVLNGAYRNNFFGFSYQLPAGFADRTAAMPKTGAGITYGLLHASEPKQATRAASSVTVFADDAAHWKATDGAQYLDKFSAQMAQRANLVGKMTSFNLGMHKFWRQDYKPHASFEVRQTVVATVIGNWVVSFVLTAPDAAGIEALMTGVKATKFLPHH